MTVATAVRTRFEFDEVEPGVRLRPAPPLDPPFEDERSAESWAFCPGQLEIRPAPGADRGAGARRPAAGATAGPAAGPTATAAPMATTAPTATATEFRPAHAAGEARIAAHRFVDVCVEVLNGFRPVAHLRAFTTPPDYVRVADQLTRRAVRLHMAPARPSTPWPTRQPRGSRAGTQPPDRVVLRRVRVCEPRAGAVEAAVVLGHGGASWAMAVRLERQHRQWHCTLVQVI
jgi:hypothetical protein